MNKSSITRGNVTLNNLDVLEDINARIFSRNIPSRNLPPCLSVRSMPTKYTTFQVNSDIKVNNTNSIPTNYTVDSVFLPCDRQGPYSGFSNKINDESYLRNQFFAMQSCPEAYWIPDSSSELYSYNVDANIKPGNISQQHPNLFRKDTFGYFNPNPDNRLGVQIFNNSTRCQLKNIERN